MFYNLYLMHTDIDNHLANGRNIGLIIKIFTGVRLWCMIICVLKVEVGMILAACYSMGSLTSLTTGRVNSPVGVNNFTTLTTPS